MNRGFASIALIIALVVIVVGVGGWWYLNKSNTLPAVTQPLTLQEEHARDFNSALHHAYDKLNEEKKLRPGNGTDVTNIVLQYIPIGTSFDDAERLLRLAGFQVDSRPGEAPTRPGVYGVTAVFKPFAKTFAATTELIVYLDPKAPGDFSKVSKVSASFFVSSI